MASKEGGVVRVGLIGAGGISGAHVKGFIKHREKIRCVAMVEVSQENVKKRTEQFTSAGLEAPRAFDDWKVMLDEKRDEIDAVDICLPHHLLGPAILDA